MTTTNELNTEIETKKNEISQIAHQIGDRVEEYVDWKGMVQQRPLESVGIAVGLGLILTGAAVPLVKFVGRQAGTIAKGSLTAYLMNYAKTNLLATGHTTSPVA